MSSSAGSDGYIPPLECHLILFAKSHVAGQSLALRCHTHTRKRLEGTLVDGCALRALRSEPATGRAPTLLLLLPTDLLVGRVRLALGSSCRANVRTGPRVRSARREVASAKRVVRGPRRFLSDWTLAALGAKSGLGTRSGAWRMAWLGGIDGWEQTPAFRWKRCLWGFIVSRL
jgi:hypothetical protein